MKKNIPPTNETEQTRSTTTTTEAKKTVAKQELKNAMLTFCISRQNEYAAESLIVQNTYLDGYIHGFLTMLLIILGGSLWALIASAFSSLLAESAAPEWSLGLWRVASMAIALAVGAGIGSIANRKTKRRLKNIEDAYNTLLKDCDKQIKEIEEEE